MTLTDRDRKILKFLIPGLLCAVYWFMLLSPKREEAARAGDELAKQQARQEAAESQAAQVNSAKKAFTARYVELVQLGKAVPSSLDLPGVLVQLEHAARGTGIRFNRVASVDAAAAPAAAPPSGGGKPADAGGAPAQSDAGKATENANEAAASPSGSAASGTSADAAGLQKVPLELQFSGGFFELARFFARLEGFVRMAGDRLLVRGRLVTIDAVKFTSGDSSFPALKAEAKATVYIAPKASSGPAPGGTQASSASSSPAPSGASPPTATAKTP